METNKKASVIFLLIINIINILAGATAQWKISFNQDITSILHISGDYTVNQILMMNFAVVVVVMFLISVLVTYLTTDIPYSPAEIIKNMSPIFLIFPAVILFWGIFNGVRAEFTADKIWIIVCSVVYFLISGFDIACLLIVKSDSEE